MRKGGGLRLSIGLAAMWLSAVALPAQPVATLIEPAPAPAPSLPAYGRVVWHEAGYVFASPARWDEEDWYRFGGAVAAVAGTAALLDRPVRDAAQRNSHNWAEHFADNFEPFGAEYSFGVLGAFYLGGFVADDNRAKVVAEDGLAASLFSGSIALVMKEMVGRSRPPAHRGVFHFSPFSGSASFPSGHATQAFTVASVIAAHYRDNPWVDSAAYGVAALVGAARINHNAHFASDVLAGALIGTAVGRTVARYRYAPHPDVYFYPDLAPRFVGFAVGLDF